MPQCSYNGRERRREPRQPRAFALWVRRVGHADRTRAWMVDTSTGGAAFLVPADQAPAVGELVEFSEMPTTDPFVREGALPLPRVGRVLRLDAPDGLTRRVAVRIEADAAAKLDATWTRAIAACRTQSRGLPLIPPPMRPAGPKRQPAHA